tara:strand:- start:732 stop:1259 length:528 start_codon:yes stop_codon:yes gene_type:complete
MKRISIQQLKLKEDIKAKTKSFFMLNPYVKVDKKFTEFLKKFSKRNSNCDVRICVHEGPKSTHHDMILYQKKGNFYSPHKHNHCGDTYHVIEGKLACFLFDEKGNITYRCIIKQNEIFKTPKKVYHVTSPITDVIYHESKTGKFKSRTNSIFPKWAPKTKEEINGFKKNLFKNFV